ncbi:MAG: DUF3006 domain-containing protein [Tissierellaceae bacterium]
MKFIIDRFEDAIAVVELDDKEIIDIPRQILPRDAKEGDVIIVSISKEETEERRKRIEDKFRLLFGDRDD